ncbi:MAG: pilus assembly protein N-terminal domain-containing protein, partial [Alphaproteobacteria bacterium]|nr:pilus assembly protein N-terminal domain-containing protein [Alphaproteobacteria bacterium]
MRISPLARHFGATALVAALTFAGLSTGHALEADVPAPAVISAAATAPVTEKSPVHQVKLESPAQTVAPQTVTRALNLDVNKSRIIHLSRPARDVLVANPAIADVGLRSPDTAFVVGRKVGETNVYFFDADGHQIDGVDVTVKFDSGAVATVLHQMLPSEQIQVATANQSLVLTGSVASAQDAENARQIARQFVADDNSIINLLSIRDKSQVLLRVHVSEMSRQVVKELGITPGQPTPFNFSIGGSHFSFTGNTPNFTGNTPFGALSSAIPLGGSTTFTS